MVLKAAIGILLNQFRSPGYQFLVSEPFRRLQNPSSFSSEKLKKPVKTTSNLRFWTLLGFTKMPFNGNDIRNGYAADPERILIRLASGWKAELRLLNVRLDAFESSGGALADAG